MKKGWENNENFLDVRKYNFFSFSYYSNASKIKTNIKEYFLYAREKDILLWYSY